MCVISVKEEAVLVREVKGAGKLRVLGTNNRWLLFDH